MKFIRTAHAQQPSFLRESDRKTEAKAIISELIFICFCFLSRSSKCPRLQFCLKINWSFSIFIVNRSCRDHKTLILELCLQHFCADGFQTAIRINRKLWYFLACALKIYQKKKKTSFALMMVKKVIDCLSFYYSKQIICSKRIGALLCFTLILLMRRF